MYSDVFCQVYHQLGWNYYPEAFGQQLLKWMEAEKLRPGTALDLGCGTGVLCRILDENGIRPLGVDLSEGMVSIAREENPGLCFEVGDMITYQPGCGFDLVTCTGDALNHISGLEQVEQIFHNVYGYLQPGGFFVFDILNEREAPEGEPFEMEYSDRIRVSFQMLRPADRQVNLRIRVWEDGVFAFEENIRETLHCPEEICGLLCQCGFHVKRCADSLLEDGSHGTTWFLIAQKPHDSGQGKRCLCL